LSADIAARVGIAIDRGLVYGKAGMSAGQFAFSDTDSTPEFVHGSRTLADLLLGGGIEYTLAPNWTAFLEYDRIAYTGGVVQFDASGTTPFNQTESATVNEAKAGINYRFGGASLPAASSRSQNILPPPATDWTGCYAGVHAGGGIIEDTFVPPGWFSGRWRNRRRPGWLQSSNRDHGLRPRRRGGIVGHN
jgi:hypothetical protein